MSASLTLTPENFPALDMRAETLVDTPVETSVETVREAEEAVSVPAEPRKPVFYPGDLICYKARKPYEWTPFYGKVLPPTPTPTKSESKESKEHGSSEDPLPKVWNFEDGLTGTLNIMWCHSDRLGSVQDSEIGLVDRFLPREQRVKNAEGIKGTVRNSVSKVTVQVLNTNHVIDNVPIVDLLPVSPFTRGIEVLFHGWVGVITAVRRNLQCKMDSGLLFRLQTSETDGFMRADPYWGAGTPCPSIRSRFSASSLKSARFNAGFMRWIHKWFPPASYFYSSSYATILGVEASELEVKWLQKCLTSKYASDTPPPKTILAKDFRDLKTLGLPSYETIGVNSVRMYAVKTSDVLTSYSNWFSSFQAKFLGKGSAGFNHFFSPSNSSVSHWAADKQYEVPVKLIARQTLVEVEWDNGVHERLSGTKVPYILKNKEDKNYPTGLVVQPVYDTEGYKKYGIIQNSDDCDTPVTKMVNVKWIVPGTARANGETLDMEPMRESIYDLKGHPSVCMYRKGTIVFIKDHPQGFEAGTVLELDIRAGHLLLAVPQSKKLVGVWPHMVTALSKRCYWSFFSRTWITDDILLPTYQLVTENGNGTPSDSVQPVSLKVNDNNNSVSKLQGTLWDETDFEFLPEAPVTHRYHDFELKNIRPELARILQNEAAQLKGNVPEGIWVRAYENRLDLFSALILGPDKTPYEDGLFCLDLQIPENFPSCAPRVHFVPYTTSVLSPFLAPEGAFCVSKLEWPKSLPDPPPASYIATALKQIQALIFVDEPYFQSFERGKEKGTVKGELSSRSCNEQIFLNVLTSLHQMALKPYDPWRRQIRQHLSALLPEKISGVRQWISTSEPDSDMDAAMPPLPSFHLLPVSPGFEKAISLRLQMLESILPPCDKSEENAELPVRPTSASAAESVSSVDQVDSAESHLDTTVIAASD